MGKSNKKIKAERINILRKQFDAFLEDDKKRKDRNEYILGRLDKMSSSTAMVPMRHNHKVNVIPLSRHAVFYERPDNIQKYASTYDEKLTACEQKIDPNINLTTKFLDDSEILKEVSKKYILIPRIQTNNMLNESNITTADPLLVDNTDWRSKYNILDQLKRSEKEGTEYFLKPTKDVTQNRPEELNSNNYSPSGRTQISLTRDKDINQENDIIPIHHNAPKVIFNERNEKEINIHSKPYVTKEKDPDVDIDCNDFKNIEYHADDHKIEKSTPGVVEIINDSEKVDYDTQESPVAETEMKIEGISQNESMESTDSVNLDNNFNSRSKQDVFAEYSDHVTIQDTTKLDNTEHDTNLQQTQEKSFYEQENHSKENMDYANESISEQEISPENQEPHQEQNIDPREYENLVTTVENLQDNDTTSRYVEDIDNHASEIAAFDTEQKEMFYSERQEENFPYSEVTTEEHTTTYTNDVEQSQQDNTYDYYEGAQQEGQEYSTEIDQHQESTEHYDPNYEQQYQYDNQQYEGDGYVNEPYEQEVAQNADYNDIQQTQNVYEEHTSQEVNAYPEQQIDTQNYYENQQIENQEIQQEHMQDGYDNVPQEYSQDESNIQEQVEQQFDTEEGYNYNENLESSNVVENMSSTPTEPGIQQVIEK